MLGANMAALKTPDILREIDNVIDERDFNGQACAGYRNMIMKADELLLSRVWGPGANVSPTVGTPASLSNIRNADDLLRLHHAYRAPQRTYMVVAGPVDIQSTLQLLASRFNAIPRGDESVLRPIPPSLAPTASGRISANISLNSGTRSVSLSGLVSAYGPDADVIAVMQHLAGVLGSQPAVKNHGVRDVAMYVNPQSHATTYTLLAKVPDSGPEEAALTAGQHALEMHVMGPLRTFNNPAMLRTLLKQYRDKTTEELQGGPQEVAALAVQGIQACGKASLAWHVDDRFADHRITPDRVRAVANRIFDDQQMAIVRCTSSDGSVHTAPVSNMVRVERPGAMAAFCPTVSCSHLLPDCGGVSKSTGEYMRQSEAAEVHPVMVKDRRGNVVACCAYNANRVYPLSKRTLSCTFGTLHDYGGWAQSLLVAEAMNAISKVVAGGACKFELERGTICATVEHRASAPTLWTQPLVSCVAMAAATGGVVGNVRGIDQLRVQLPAAALHEAVLTAAKMYEAPSKVALNQTRSQMCDPMDPGYAPADLLTAKQLLGAQHSFVCSGLRVLSTAVPRLLGTNASASEMMRTVQKLGMVAAEAKHLSTSVDLSPDVVRSMLVQGHKPDITIVRTMPGLRTYPYVASAQAAMPLQRADRAAFLVSNQVMVGGMGSVYTHDLRQRGVSYRPAGGVRLGWQQNPVLLLHATFDASQAEEGQHLTTSNLTSWCTGDASVFTAEAVGKAKRAILEQLQLSRMDYKAQKYSLWADLDPDKFSSGEVREAISAVKAADITRVMPRYFSHAPAINQSWVKAVLTQ